MTTTLRRKLVRAGRHFGPTWRYVFNFKPTLAYRRAPHALAAEQAHILADLNRDGIARTTDAALFGEGSLFDALEAAVAQAQAAHAEALDALRARAGDPADPGEKSFMHFYLGEKPVLDPPSIYAQYALQKPLLQIANAYFGMITRMRYYNVWHTFASQAQARASQLWHRDREDYHILKVFLYLKDVDDGAGPFTYAPGTHFKGATRQDPAFFLEGKVPRSTDEQMARVVPEAQWITARGKKGSIVFADTRGYHRGGLARTDERLLYTCMFTSPGCPRVYFQRPEGLQLPDDPAQALALAS